MIIPFGKYKGQTVKDIFLIDPDYVRWLSEKGSEALKAEAKMILYPQDKEGIRQKVIMALVRAGETREMAERIVRRLSQKE